MKPRALIAQLVLTTALVLLPMQGRADDWSQFEATDETTLADQRGGFLVADGIAFDFAAKMQTFIDGQLALETTMTWTPAGKQVEQTAYGDLVLTQMSNIQSMLSESNRSLLSSGAGLYVGGDGQTVLMQQAVNGGLQNVLLNTADGQTIHQDLALNITLPDAANFAATMGQGQLVAALNRDITQAAITAQ
jgi:hypothetical protein